MRYFVSLLIVTALAVGVWWLEDTASLVPADNSATTTTSSVSTMSDSVDWQIYENTRFGYEVEYPEILTAQPPAENSDGQIFSAETEMLLRVSGRHNIDEQALRDLVNEEASQLTSMTGAHVGSTTAELSGTVADGQLRKVKILRTDEEIAVARLTYTEEVLRSDQAEDIISSFQWQSSGQ